jgi:hypothetical protein
MKNFLPEVGILDVVPDNGVLRFRARVTGTALASVLVNATGHYLDEIVPEPFLARWEAMLKLALDVGGPVRTISRVEFRDQNYLRAETLYAPLGPDNSPIEAILVVSHSELRPEYADPASAA